MFSRLLRTDFISFTFHSDLFTRYLSPTFPVCKSSCKQQLLLPRRTQAFKLTVKEHGNGTTLGDDVIDELTSSTSRLLQVHERFLQQLEGENPEMRNTICDDQNTAVEELLQEHLNQLQVGGCFYR